MMDFHDLLSMTMRLHAFLPRSRELVGKSVDALEVLRHVLAAGTDGLAVSGGEPLQRAMAAVLLMLLFTSG